MSYAPSPAALEEDRGYDRPLSGEAGGPPPGPPSRPGGDRASSRPRTRSSGRRAGSASSRSASARSLTFYTMFRREPAGRDHHPGLPQRQLHAGRRRGRPRDTSPRSSGSGRARRPPTARFTLITVECLGTCDQAPCLRSTATTTGRRPGKRSTALLEELEAHG